ncbi:hypothetical protein KC957_03635, partial [Candidatus Saccharibacteria bacterium]|nr:hypothetical protein [Candidatus Saccharibacteria bacterium]
MRAELNGLDGDTYQASGYPGFNGLMSMYQQLPEHRIAATIGSVVCVVFDDGDFMEMQPVAAYGDFVIARDLETPIQEQDVPEYVVLGGSILLDEMYVSVHGSDLLVPAISKAIEKGRKADSFVPELNTGFIYRPGVFCHSARLATAQAYTMDELRQTH